ncbi:MAG: UTP--glucose-1-phosphate uridylyltransferase, partial [Candidatus Aenigmatarchaeota archaeon]
LFCRDWLEISKEERARLEHRIPVLVEPFVYEYRINEKGISCELVDEETFKEALMHTTRVYGKNIPLDVNALNCKFNEDDFRELQIRYRKGEIGFVKNRLRRDEISSPQESDIENIDEKQKESGIQSIRNGELACISPNGGAGTRFMGGAVVKGACPLFKVGDGFRSFVELKIAQNKWARKAFRGNIRQGFINSYATHDTTKKELGNSRNYGLDSVFLATDTDVMIRVVPGEEDLRHRHALRKKEHHIRERLEEQAMEGWVRLYNGKKGQIIQTGGKNPLTKFSPPGHFDVFVTLFESGIIPELLTEGVKYIMLSNIDNLAAVVDPSILGTLKNSGKSILVELTSRWKDVGGALVLHQGKKRLLEGIAFPDKESELSNPYFNTATYWIDIERLLDDIGMDKTRTHDKEYIKSFMRSLRKRMPVYVLIKDSFEEFDHGIIEPWPVAQFERLFGDITTMVDASYVFVDRRKRFYPIKLLEEKRRALEAGLQKILEETTVFN